ncbi:CAP family protein [Actinokineospora pegani]|uniref:CAP family protein n=1 Tax=Actinokineospora pegani TaxID=2654637 RepID=UPI0012E9A9AF|nr:CAP family protein [Actinokineospora pegani]
MSSSILSAVMTLAAVAAPVSPSAEAPAPEFKQEALAAHNEARAQYGAEALTWNDSLYDDTLAWARSCKFEHSDNGGRYGENLAAQTPALSARDAVNMWMSEVKDYDYANPGFSTATGHFTQVVWKSTTQVAVAAADCPAGTVLPEASVFVVARYTPPGNFTDQFAQNVGPRV